MGTLCLATATMMSLSSVYAGDGDKAADMTKPVKVYILMGQSNMLSMGKVKGSLDTAVKEKKLYAYLVDDAGNWKMRKDVRNVFIMNNNLKLNEWMGVQGGKIGVEIAIGNFVGDAVDSPVLILKSCIGNRSLGWDLLPPGSEQFEAEAKLSPGKRQKAVQGTWIFAGYKDSPAYWLKGTEPKKIGWYAGTQWDTDIAGVNKVLSEIGKYYPGATKYEVAGFFLWQGDKDRYNAVHAANYEKNLVQFIKALRKEFKAPKAPFVCATLGQTPKEGAKNPNEALILKAQMAVDGKSGKHPEFKGNVSTFYSHPVSKGGASNGHYNRNAETYMNVGEGMGKAMADLIKEK